MVRRSAVVAAAAGASALLGGGCSGDGGAPATAPTVSFEAPPTADGSPVENAALPLTSLQRPSLTDRNLVGRAAHLVTAECMAEQGFDYLLLEPAVPSALDLDHPFGPWTAEEVPTFYAQVAPEPRYSHFEQFIATLPPDLAQAWGEALGNPSGALGPDVVLPDGTRVDSSFSESRLAGCAGQGMNAVHGDVALREALRQEIEALVNEAFVEAEGDDAVEQALDVWHDCMEAEGIDVASGGDGPQDLIAEYGSEPGVSDEERVAAEADIRCKVEANLHDAYFAARAEVEQALIEEHQVFVEAWRELVEESLVRARGILAQAGG